MGRNLVPLPKEPSASLAELLWFSWSDGLDAACERDFTQIPPWCQEQGWDYPSLAAGNGTVGQPERSGRAIADTCKN